MRCKINSIIHFRTKTVTHLELLTDWQVTINRYHAGQCQWRNQSIWLARETGSRKYAAKQVKAVYKQLVKRQLDSNYNKNLDRPAGVDSIYPHRGGSPRQLYPVASGATQKSESRLTQPSVVTPERGGRKKKCTRRFWVEIFVGFNSCSAVIHCTDASEYDS